MRSISVGASLTAMNGESLRADPKSSGVLTPLIVRVYCPRTAPNPTISGLNLWRLAMRTMSPGDISCANLYPRGLWFGPQPINTASPRMDACLQSETVALLNLTLGDTTQ